MCIRDRRYTVDNQSKDIIKYEDLTIDIGAYEVIYKGNIVRLAPKELELFHFMASNPNKVFTREQLMFEVWGYDYQMCIRDRCKREWILLFKLRNK